MVDRSSRIKISAGQIFWRETGNSEDPILIFLHGSWHDSQQWQHIVAPLSETFHCFAIDLLGFGNSVAIKTPTSIDMEVDALHEFLVALKLRPVHLVGHSLGAWIAISYALKYPDLVQGVVAISPEGFSLAYWQQYNQFTRWLLVRPRLFKLWLGGLKTMASIGDGIYPAAKNQSQWALFSKFPTTYRLLFERPLAETESELVANKLAQFRVPFMVLQSDADSQLTIEQSQAYAKAVWKSEYQWLNQVEPILSQPIPIQIALKISGFVDQIQLKIDREEIDLW